MVGTASTGAHGDGNGDVPGPSRLGRSSRQSRRRLTHGNCIRSATGTHRRADLWFVTAAGTGKPRSLEADPTPGGIAGASQFDSLVIVFDADFVGIPVLPAERSPRVMRQSLW
jgi:hypothetical protein